ncbi:hypothetical protein [Methylobacterium haplocladii]|uniref:Uncharacterized protein n=2 Tax=Methylobacterium haplocladii TaxID=1176176 RepID=A0A512INH1_9HYPH|nr:hypothetical protein [Methylobacterium haplocladii]GEO99254.1 hypothetical protein MHA02_16420 [Methylobacterium haplocladii]GJD83545.1 hypothetical protein HPGCJGGD_1414 [Methylobacterium haplocladii]GLS60304.1 hypothetical protein GCM10007887_29830 [Methylobacterium haplocladii]
MFSKSACLIFCLTFSQPVLSQNIDCQTLKKGLDPFEVNQEFIRRSVKAPGEDLGDPTKDLAKRQIFREKNGIVNAYEDRAGTLTKQIFVYGKPQSMQVYGKIDKPFQVTYRQDLPLDFDYMGSRRNHQFKVSMEMTTSPGNSSVSESNFKYMREDQMIISGCLFGVSLFEVTSQAQNSPLRTMGQVYYSPDLQIALQTEFKTLKDERDIMEVILKTRDIRPISQKIAEP